MKKLIICVLTTSLTMASIAMGSEENLAKNPSFELPENGEGQVPADWMFFTSKMNTMGLSDNLARTGVQSLKFASQKVPEAYQGMHYDMAVAEGEKYTFSLFMIGDKDDRIGGSAHGTLVIEWKRDDGSEVARTVSKVWHAREVSRLRWEQVAIIKEPVPKGATKGVFGIHLSEGNKGGKGCVYVDDVVIERH